MKITKKLAAIVASMAIASTVLGTTAFAAGGPVIPYGQIYDACGDTRLETLTDVNHVLTFKAGMKQDYNGPYDYYNNYNHRDIAGIVVVNQTDVDSLYSAAMLCEYYNCMLVFSEDTVYGKLSLDSFGGYESDTFNIFTVSTGNNKVKDSVVNDIKNFNSKAAIKTNVIKITGSNRVDTNTKILNYIINNKSKNELGNDRVTVCVMNQDSYSDLASAYNDPDNILYMLVSNNTLTTNQKKVCKALGLKNTTYELFGSTAKDGNNSIERQIRKAVGDTSQYVRSHKVVGSDRYATNVMTMVNYKDNFAKTFMHGPTLLVDGTSEVDCLIAACSSAISDRHDANILLVSKSNPKVLNSINYSLKKAGVKSMTTTDYNNMNKEALYISIGTAGSYAKL